MAPSSESRCTRAGCITILHELQTLRSDHSLLATEVDELEKENERLQQAQLQWRDRDQTQKHLLAEQEQAIFQLNASVKTLTAQLQDAQQAGMLCSLALVFSRRISFFFTDLSP